ncbi:MULTISPECIES: hypothetical protein [Prochlorococcus]|uniref:Uncharacterized protein n=1 Tax=Prochlorococcus marinus (strain SARG / CCMP1375 / SS120) TaxID=167539 RepID=Q7VCS9_PROMA|nr:MULTISPECIES: hypothetical protein [Prochlorococcus]AAP99705.1 Predicted protein family PM-8 [Prochlorococcus marinus subsp. marinus str. CCMP1375]KGG13399.1 hypothetical protein EV04_0634 [Prochlorococcus marinus str. LG]KGG21357.1 hypothetical protein EV08_0765 [Prochlorococcus marinus str. SS2]KGG24311.1 hypothetical protein EV09_0358 [Prochlorococcus marinus str. SS35]KGG33595.1 hypothetical protein EV10_0435 [Prochlorococcus marinus str. SS51]
MTTPLEFSEVYKLLNAIKQGDKSKNESLNSILREYKEGENAESFLHELGQNFLYLGVEELFKYTNSSNLQFIGQLTKEEWDVLANNNNCDLPVHLANTMINYLKDNKFSERLSLKWNKSIGEVEKHVMPMARYITEGIIDVLE